MTDSSNPKTGAQTDTSPLALAQPVSKFDEGAMGEFKKQLGEWFKVREAEIATPACNPRDSYANLAKIRASLGDVIDQQFPVTLATMFAKCDDCMLSCPDLLEHLHKEYSAPFRSVGYEFPDTKVYQHAMCIEKFCPVAFGDFACGTYYYDTKKREFYTYAILAIAVLVLVACCSVYMMFRRKKVTSSQPLQGPQGQKQ